jgi:hypothetical protein
MAQIDPSIAMGFRPVQIESPVNQMAAIAQMQGAQQQAQMNALKMQEFRQQQNERNALARLMQSPGVDTSSPDFLREVARVAPGQYEGFVTRAAQREELGEKTAARKQKNFETKFNLFKSFIPQVNSSEGVAQIVTAMYNDPDLKDTLGQIAPFETALQTNQEAFTRDPDNWRLTTSGASAKDILQMQTEKTRLGNEAARLQLEDARVQETQRHQKVMESISGTQAERQLKQLEETQRHNKVMEGLDARRVSISAASEARKAEQGGVELSSKEIQKREAARPQATLAIKSIDAKAGSLIKDLQELRDHPGLNQITGLVGGRVPGVTDEARAAQALYDRIVARGGFQMLQEMREASKTGGALGNVSNQEGKQLQAAFAALDRRQGKEDLQRVIDQVISDVEGAKIRSKEAYDETYSYRSDRTTPAAPTAPAAPKPPAVGTVQDGYRFKGGNPADQKNWEKVK